MSTNEEVVAEGLIKRTRDIHGEAQILGRGTYVRYVDGVLQLVGIPYSAAIAILTILGRKPEGTKGDPWGLDPATQAEIDAKPEAKTEAPKTAPKTEKKAEPAKTETPKTTTKKKPEPEPEPEAEEEPEEEEEEEAEEEEEEIEAEEEPEEEGEEKKVYGSAALTSEEYAYVLSCMKLSEVMAILNKAGAGTAGALLKTLKIIAKEHRGLQKFVKDGVLEAKFKGVLVLRGQIEEEDEVDPTKKIKL